MPRSRPLLGSIALLLLARVASADPFVESIIPPVLEVGKTTRVTLVGRELENAESLWLSVSGVTVKAVESGAKKAVFDLSVAKDAPVGVAGLRVATKHGLGNACLVLIDDLPVAKCDASALSLPTAAWGTLREGAVDRFTMEVKAGERLSFEAVANRLGKDSDPLVIIRDPKGKVVAERDNDPGLYFDCRFAHTFETTGKYALEIRDARFHGNEHRKYVLRVGGFDAGRTPVATESKPGEGGLAFAVRKGERGSAWVPVPGSKFPITTARLPGTTPLVPDRFPFGVRPIQVNQVPGVTALLARLKFPTTTVTPANVPVELWGTLPEAGARTAFAMTLAKGQKIHVRGEALALNSPADPEVIVLDRSGRELRRSGDADVETPFDFTAPADGDYRLVVRDKQRDGGPDFAFRLTVRNDPFPPKLTAEVEGLTVPRGSYQPVPILVTRYGTAGPIKLSLRGAPAGLTLSPTEIGEKETAVVCKLSADDRTAYGIHTVQIVAEVSGEERVLVTTQPLIDVKKQNVDLIPIALRDDQRRLPPSVADRFAVFVTPPAPFAFELPKPLVTLPRYQSAPIPVVTARVPGFDGPIRFAATGGQLADKNEGRTRVYAEFPEAGAKQPEVSGKAVSKILSNTAKARIDVTATGTHAGRRVTLTRCFDLDLVTAFKLTPETPKLTLVPGESATVRYAIDRVPSFEGPVSLRLNPQDGLSFDEVITVAKGQSTVDVKVSATPTATARRANLSITATATVDGYEEEVRLPNVEIEVKPPEPKKGK